MKTLLNINIQKLMKRKSNLGNSADEGSNNKSGTLIEKVGV